VNLANRMAGIDANLDDLQAGIEAGGRATNTLQTGTAKFNGSIDTPLLLRVVERHVKDLQACARDQRAAMQELREGLSRLRRELKGLHRVMGPPLAAADHARR